MKNQGRSVATKFGWSNGIQFTLWSMVNESKLVGRWPLKAGGERSGPFSSQMPLYSSDNSPGFCELEGSGGSSTKQIYLAQDSNEFSKHYGSGTLYKPLVGQPQWNAPLWLADNAEFARLFISNP